MGSLIIHFDNNEQLSVFEAMAKALKLSFQVKKENKSYNPEWVEMMNRSVKQAKEGKITTIKTENLWK